MFGRKAQPDNEEFARQREQMVKRQLESRDIKHPGVLAAFRKVPRHLFVNAANQPDAYADHPIPIGHGQTISQPYVVAFMTQALAPKPTDRVLEIGTGSGYQTAILAQVVAAIYAIEIVPELAELAQKNLGACGVSNVHVRHGDGRRGWPEHAPYDAILAAAAAEDVPPALKEQLVDGGRMILPVGGRDVQTLRLLRKEDGELRVEDLLDVRFVPMTGSN